MTVAHRSKANAAKDANKLQLSSLHDKLDRLCQQVLERSDALKGARAQAKRRNQELKKAKEELIAAMLSRNEVEWSASTNEGAVRFVLETALHTVPE